MRSKKYGLIITHTDNIGDEIQALATRAFLPKVDYFINRDQVDMRLGDSDDLIYTIMNGWWCHAPESWPPAENIVPLFTSVHLSPFRSPRLGLIPIEIFTAAPAVELLKHFGPVGARDLGTRDALAEASVESFFSGCMTLTLERRKVERDPNLIVVNDVPNEVADFVKSKTQKQIRATRHAGFAKLPLNARFDQAEQFLRLYASARCVITTRLHCALPCVAMGTPVLLLTTADDPQRFAGLIDFVDHSNIKDFMAGSFDVNYPPPARTDHLATADTLRRSVKTFLDRPTSRDPFIFSENDRHAIRHTCLSKISSEIQYLRDIVRKLRAKQSV